MVSQTALLTFSYNLSTIPSSLSANNRPNLFNILISAPSYCLSFPSSTPGHSILKHSTDLPAPWPCPSLWFERLGSFHSLPLLPCSLSQGLASHRRWYHNKSAVQRIETLNQYFLRPAISTKNPSASVLFNAAINVIGDPDHDSSQFRY